MEEEYNAEIALEIIQLEMSKLLNNKYTSYKDFKKELDILKKKEKEVYSMDKKTIDELCKKYKNRLRNGGISNAV